VLDEQILFYILIPHGYRVKTEANQRVTFRYSFRVVKVGTMVWGRLSIIKHSHCLLENCCGAVVKGVCSGSEPHEFEPSAVPFFGVVCPTKAYIDVFRTFLNVRN
jgi:hypothetical protein